MCALSHGLGLLGGRPISAEEVSPTLSMLVEKADRITVAEVDAMRRAIEEKVVHTKNGQQIMGKFVSPMSIWSLPSTSQRMRSTR